MRQLKTCKTCSYRFCAGRSEILGRQHRSPVTKSGSHQAHREQHWGKEPNINQNVTIHGTNILPEGKWSQFRLQLPRKVVLTFFFHATRKYNSVAHKRAQREKLQQFPPWKLQRSVLRVRQGITAVSSARPQRLPVEMKATEGKACKNVI